MMRWKPKDRSQWSHWFAWHPVHLEDLNAWAWLEPVERQRRDVGQMDIEMRWRYRLPPIAAIIVPQKTEWGVVGDRWKTAMDPQPRPQHYSAPLTSYIVQSDFSREKMNAMIQIAKECGAKVEGDMIDCNVMSLEQLNEFNRRIMEL